MQKFIRSLNYVPDHPPMNVSHPNYQYPNYYLIVPHGTNKVVPVPSPIFFNEKRNDEKIRGRDGSVSKMYRHHYNIGLKDSHFLHFPFNDEYGGNSTSRKFYMRTLPKNLILFRGRKVPDKKKFDKIIDEDTLGSDDNQWYADFLNSLMYTNKEKPYQFIYKVQRDLMLFDMTDAYAVQELVFRIQSRYFQASQKIKEKSNSATYQAAVLEQQKMYKYMVVVNLALGQTSLVQKGKMDYLQKHLPRQVAKVYADQKYKDYIENILDILPNIPVANFKNKNKLIPPVHADVFYEAKTFYHGFGMHPAFLSRTSITNLDNDLVDCIRMLFPDCDGYIGGPMLSLNKKSNLFHPEICLFGNKRRKIGLIKVLSTDNEYVNDPRLAISEKNLRRFSPFYQYINMTRDMKSLNENKKMISDIIDENLKNTSEQNGTGPPTVSFMARSIPSMYSKTMAKPSMQFKRNPAYFTPDEVLEKYNDYITEHQDVFQDKNFETVEDAEKWRQMSLNSTKKINIQEQDEQLLFGLDTQ